MDYRELEKSGLLFDRVVSVGMLEHVGRSNYDLFMKCVSKVGQKEGLHAVATRFAIHRAAPSF